jgi:ABC-type nitrate/sulfonate/bicarbonate transport system permease component
MTAIRGVLGSKAAHVLVPVAIVIFAFVVWDLVVRLSDIPTYVLPSPGSVFDKLWADRSTLADLTGTTLVETVVGFVTGTGIGFLLAVWMAHSRAARRGVYPILIATQAVPVIAIAVALVIWLGFGLAPKVAIIALWVFFPVTVNVLDGLTNVDADMIRLAQAMGARPLPVFLHIRLPAALTPLFSALKLAAAYCVTGAVIGEWTASTTRGLGNYLLEKNSRLDTAGVFAAILILAAMGITGFLIVAGVERLATPWRTRSVARRLPWRQPRRPAAELSLSTAKGEMP